MSIIIRPTLDTTTDLAITMASLASDTNLLAGRSSAAWDFTSNPCFEILLNWKFTCGTSPSANKQVLCYPIGQQLINAGNAYADVFDGTDKNVTVTSANVLANLLPPGRGPIVGITDSTSNRVFYGQNISLANYFGGTPPMKGQIFFVHNTGVAANATGSNFVATLTPKYVTAT